MFEEKKFELSLELEQWKQFISSSEYVSNRVKSGRPRKTFLAPFTRVLNEKLQEKGLSKITNF